MSKACGETGWELNPVQDRCLSEKSGRSDKLEPLRVLLRGVRRATCESGSSWVVLWSFIWGWE